MHSLPGDTPRKNRKEETVMARLHIGHSFLTHSFLLKGEELPMCIGCDEHLTIEYISITCSNLIETRESQSLHVLFQEVSLEKTFNFLTRFKVSDINLGYV